MKVSISDAVRAVEKVLVELEEKTTREVSTINTQGLTVYGRRLEISGAKFIRLTVDVSE